MYSEQSCVGFIKQDFFFVISKVSGSQANVDAKGLDTDHQAPVAVWRCGQLAALMLQEINKVVV